MGLMLGPHAHTIRAHETRVAEPWLPAPRDGRPGEGQRLTPDAPHNGGRPPPPGRPPTNPAAGSPPQGMQAKGTVLGPHTRTPAPAARAYRTPTARPQDGRPGQGERLNSDAPHNGARQPPRGRPPATPTVRNDGSQEGTLRGSCWVPTLTPTAPGNYGSRNPGCSLQGTGGRGRDSARHQTPLTTVEGRPPPGRPPATPAASSPRQGMQAKGTVLSPHARTAVPTPCG